MPEVIYHYTSNDVLLKILENGSLRLSAKHHLNDSMEGEQFFSLLETHESKPDAAKLASVREALGSFEFFVSCFSSCGDRLSQWRGYASNGAGVAIGFNRAAIVNAIKGSHEALLYQVEYVDDLRYVSLGRASTISAILTKLSEPNPKALLTFAKERWSFKSSGFSEEQELRLIMTIDGRCGALQPVTPLFEIGYFATATEVREFCEFKFGMQPNASFIESITLGPTNRTDQAVLRRLLDSRGYSAVSIERSELPYR